MMIINTLVLAGILAVLLSLRRDINEFRRLIGALNEPHPLSADRDPLLRAIASDIRTTKRRLMYLNLIATDLRRLLAYVEKQWGIHPADIGPESEVNLPTDRLLGIREIERDMPLTAKYEEEKRLLEGMIQDWKRRADEDEFEEAAA